LGEVIGLFSMISGIESPLRPPSFHIGRIERIAEIWPAKAANAPDRIQALLHAYKGTGIRAAVRIIGTPWEIMGSYGQSRRERHRGRQHQGDESRYPHGIFLLLIIETGIEHCINSASAPTTPSNVGCKDPEKPDHVSTGNPAAFQALMPPAR
jgi:hypothetical protein